jgi:hypothetical protein
MTDLLPPRDVPTSRRRPWPEPRTVVTAGVVVSAALLAVAVAGLLLDDRVITGAPAWLKPAKFGVSITVYLLTLRWLLSCVRGHRRAVAVTGVVIAVGLVAELAYIGAQVVRGTTSHYNEATPLDAALYRSMGVLISVVFVATAVVGVLALRNRRLDAGVAAGIRWGVGVCLLGMAEAVLMVTNGDWNPTGGHTVGAPDGGPGMVLTGWSLQHGDLRVAHFAGLHALQVLPLLAWFLARRTGLDARTRARLVAVAGSAHAGLVVLLAWQALRGQPLLRPDASTLLALGALVALAAIGVSVTLRVRAGGGPLPGRPHAVRSRAGHVTSTEGAGRGPSAPVQRGRGPSGVRSSSAVLAPQSTAATRSPEVGT